MPTPRKLTAKQQAFVQQYLIDLNATAAAARAGYRDPNIGRQLITKNNVADAIAAAMAERAQRTHITQDWVLERLKKEAEREDASATHAARVKALHLAGLHLQMFPRQVELTIEEKSVEETSSAQLLQEIRARRLLCERPGSADGDGAPPAGHEPP